MIEIKHVGGRVLFTAECASDVRAALVEAVRAGANLTGADLGGAYLRGAYLGGADLYGADLGGAYLRGAYLGGADLTGADLGGADLTGADLGGADLGGAYLGGAYLGGAKGLNPLLTTPLHMLLDQPGPIRAYKLVTAGLTGPTYQGITYTLGATVEAEANTDPTIDCGAGINVATLDWCLREYQPGQRVMIMEFTAADIACIPHGSDGKFRLTRATVVGEKTLTELGLA